MRSLKVKQNCEWMSQCEWALRPQSATTNESETFLLAVMKTRALFNISMERESCVVLSGKRLKGGPQQTLGYYNLFLFLFVEKKNIRNLSLIFVFILERQHSQRQRHLIYVDANVVTFLGPPLETLKFWAALASKLRC